MRARFLSIFAARYSLSPRTRGARTAAWLLLFVIASAPSVSAQSASTGEAPPPMREVLSQLSRGDYRELGNQGSITHFFTDGVELTLAPDIRGVEDIRGALESMAPKVGIESLYLLRKHLPGDSTRERERVLYNILRSISTMEGIEYYSASRERMRIFYTESYVINNPEDKERRDDPLVSEIPQTDTIYVYQRDSSFGRNVYSVEYRYRDNAFFMSMTNLTRMYYGIAPVVGPKNLEIHLTVMETQEGYLFYGATGVDVITLLGLENRVKDSFSNRIEAIFGWFQSRIEARQAGSQ